MFTAAHAHNRLRLAKIAKNLESTIDVVLQARVDKYAEIVDYPVAIKDTMEVAEIVAENYRNAGWIVIVEDRGRDRAYEYTIEPTLVFTLPG